MGRWLLALLLIGIAGTAALAGEGTDSVDGAAAGGQPAKEMPGLADGERDEFLSLIDPETTPQMSRAPETIIPPANRQLARQIAEAQKKLAEARKRAGNSPRGETLELAQELLDISRARLLNDPSVDDGMMQKRIAAAMERAQRRIDALRIMAARSPDAERFNAQLDQLQQRLDHSQQRFAGSDTQAAPDKPGREEVAGIYAVAQQRLDEAYAKAATLPNAEHLMEQLDAAQQRLNEARAGFEARTAATGD